MHGSYQVESTHLLAYTLCPKVHETHTCAIKPKKVIRQSDTPTSGICRWRNPDSQKRSDS